MVNLSNKYPIINNEFKFIINFVWSKKITFINKLLILGIFLSFSISQVEWVDSEGEKSYIFIKAQYDSLLTRNDDLQKQLNRKILKLDQTQKDLDYCRYNAIKTSDSNFIIEQSIPLKSENPWIWLSIGILGGFTTCQLLNL